MKKLIISLALVIASIGASAQNEETMLFKHLSVGVETGLTGIGFNVGTTITDNLQLRAGMNFLHFFDFTADLNIYKGNAEGAVANLPKKVATKGTVGMTNFYVLGDFYPSDQSSFHLTGGFYIGSRDIIEVHNTNGEDALKQVYNYNQSTSYDNRIGVDFGDYLLEPTKDGKMEASIGVNVVKPYIGIGFGRAVPKTKRISCQFDLGVMFWGSPKIYLNDKELSKCSHSSSTKETLETATEINIYPVLKLSLNGKIF